MNTAKRVRTDFDDGQINHLHPPYIHESKRKYQSDQIVQITQDFWFKDATIPEPNYRKVNV